MAILAISSDLEEILRISDRVLVMHDGALTGELGRDMLSEEAVMGLATGSSDRIDQLRRIARRIFYGSSIALIIHSLDPSLSGRLID